jgi:hypothetical protein
VAIREIRYGGVLTNLIGVQTDGLQAIPTSGPGYVTTSSAGHDSNNVYAGPTVASNLQQIPVTFSDYLGQRNVTSDVVPTLVFTSLSLPQGGVFDVAANGDGGIDNPWHPPHCGHRRGNQADLRIFNVPASMRPTLRQAIEDNSFSFPVRAESPTNTSANHWHLSAQ